MELYCGSYGQRYSDPMTTFYGTSSSQVEDLLDKAVEYEAEELESCCEQEHNEDSLEDDCSLCNSEIVTWGVWPVYRIDELGGLSEAKRIIQDIREYGYATASL